MNSVRRNLLKYLPVGILALIAPKVVEATPKSDSMIVPLGNMATHNCYTQSYWKAVCENYDNLEKDPFDGQAVDEQEQFMPISGVMINRFGRITSLVIELPE